MFKNSTIKKVFTKFVSLSLAIFLFISPIDDVFGQELVESAETQVITEEANKNKSLDKKKEGLPQVVGYDDEAEQNVDDLITSEPEFGGEMQAMSLSATYDDLYSNRSFTNTRPNEPGLNSSGGHISQHGAFLYSIPFDLPEGINGLTPQTALVYNSQNADDISPFGYGWQLDVPSIKRVNEEGLDYMYSGSGRDFYSTLSNGNLNKEASLSSNVAVEEGYYFAELDDGSFYKYVFDDGYWKVTAKDGITYYFGQDSDARVENRNYTSTSSTYAVFQWYLDKVVDSKGNEIIYEYTKTPNEYTRLDTIKYVEEVDESYLYKLELNYDDAYRTYDAVTYGPGFPMKQKDVLDSATILVNDNVAATYEFGYATSSISGRVNLDSYQISKVSASGATTTLPVTTFEYTKTEAGFTLDSGFDLLPIIDTQELYNGSYNLPVVTYTREDGRQAIAGYYTEDLTTDTDFHYYYNPTTEQWVSDPSSAEGSEIFDTFFTELDILADLDGNISTHENISIQNNSMPDDIEDIIDGYTDSEIKNFVYVGDMDGDGWDDLYFFDDLGDNTEYSYYGGGASIQPSPWTYPTFWKTATWGDDIGLSWRYKWRSGLLDFNADGLDDLINNERIQYNTGTSTFETYNYSSQNPLNNLDYEELVWRYHDVNGDGLVDILETGTSTNSTAVHFQRVDGTFYRVANFIPVDFAQDGSGAVVGKGTWFFDINGDGYIDVLHTDGQDDQDVYINNADAVDLLHRVEEGSGGQLEIKYERTTELYDSSNNYENPDLPYSLNVVTNIQASDDNGSTWYDYLSYEYEDASWYWSASRSQKFAGFERITEFNHTQNKITESYFHQGNDDNTSYSEPNDDYDFIGKIYKQIVYDGTTSKKLLANYYDWYSDLQSSGLTSFIYVIRDYVSNYNSNGTSTRDIGNYYQLDDFSGNTEFVTNWGEVDFSESAWTYTDVTGDKRSFAYQYADNISALSEAQLLAVDYKFAPSEMTQTNESSEVVANAELFYDNNSTQGVLSYGLVTKVSDWHDQTSSWLNTQYAHNSVGVLNQVVDARGATTTYVIDSYNLLPTKEVNVLGHETDYTYDYRTGQQLIVVNENGTTEEFTYDGFGRPLTKKVSKPSGGLVTVASWNYNDSSFPKSTTQSIYNTSTPVNKYEYYDGFGRLVQEKTTTSNSGEYNTAKYEYDGAGRLISETLPYTSSVSSYQSSVPGSAEYVTTEYDPLDRIVGTTNPNGSISYSYNAWDTTITNENNVDKDYSYDAYGNLVEVIEYEGVNEFVTTYAYDARDRLTSVIDELSNLRLFDYDSLDRRISLELPHASGTTASIHTYEYDETGNLIEETMPDSTTITYTYDLLGRILTKDSDRESDIEVTYNYDSASNGVGYIAEIQSSDYTKSFAYDQAGNVVEEVVHYPQDVFGQMYDPSSEGSGGMGGPGSELQLLEQELGLLNFDSGIESVTDVIFDLNPAADETVNSEATTTTEAVVSNEIPTEIPKTTDINVTASTTDIPTVTEVLEPVLETTKDKEALAAGLVTNSKEADIWRRYHKERLEYLKANKSVGPEAIAAAEHAQEKYESFLIDEGYIKSSDDKISTLGYDVVSFFTNAFKVLARAVLPNKAYAYLFDKEDFESCGSLPCSLDANLGWGSVTNSLDSTGKVAGADSLKAVVTGAGGGSIETIGYNTNEIWSQFKIYIPSGFAWGTSGFFTAFKIEDPSNGTLMWMSVENYGTPRLTVMGDVLGYTNTGLDLTAGAVNTIEIRVKTGNGSGDVDIWLNNSTQGSPSYNGSGTMNLGTDNIDDILFGMHYVPENGLSTTYYDEIIVDSAFIGATTSSSSNSAPTAPSVLYAEGQTNPTNISDPIPEFSAIYNDPDNGDIATKYKLQVSTSSNFTSIFWDSSTTSMASTTKGTRSPDVIYSGSSLASSTTYYWRIKFWDDENAEGAWSTTTATLSLAAGGGGGGGSSTTTLSIYSDSLASGWDNWSYSGTYDTSATGQVYVGTYSLQATYSSQYGGLQLRNGSLNTTGYNTLDFAFYLSSGSGVNIQMRGVNKTTNTDLGYANLSSYLPGGTYTSGQWYQVSVPLSALGLQNFNGNGAIIWQSNGSPTVVSYFDDIKLVGTTTSSSSNTAPTAPSALQTESQTNPTNITDATPEFSAIYNDPDSSDNAIYYQIQVDDNSDFSSAYWNSTKSAFATTTQGARSVDISYSGSGLASSTTYYWRIKFWDDEDAEGAWSTTTATFTLASSTGGSDPIPGPEYATTTYFYTDYGLLESVVYPSGLEVEYNYNVAGLPDSVEVDSEPHVTETVYDHRGVVTDISYATNATTSFTYDVEQGYRLVAKETVKNGSTLEDIVYTYDDLGNILTIVDTGTIVPQSTVYTYDELNRLVSSDVTVASTTYSDDYAYDAIGRITTHNGTGYTYASNRHPHAPTSFGSSTYAYDVNGNISSSTESGQTTTYAYDALDRLASLYAGGTTTATYWYGDGRDRIAKAADGYTTLYINPLAEYNREGYNDAVMVGGGRISTIDESATRWHIKDHLRSTAITVGADDTLYEAIRYTPYGAERDRVGSYKSSHTYTDQVSDAESDLLYYNARYYNPTLKTFTSADPVAAYTPEQVLATPQLLNTYSYVANNPVVYVDPSGEAAYYFDNGAGMSGPGPINAVYTESGDRAILINNINLVSGGNVLDKVRFANNVRPGGIWDYKDSRHSRSHYIYDSQIVTDDEFGNINYGATGAAVGFSRKTLGNAGSLVQGLTTGKFSEPVEDVHDTTTGYRAYTSGQLSNQSTSPYQSQTSHTTRGAQIDNLITSLQNLATALQNYKNSLNN
jgi:RHS repeat-associated protein